MPDSGPKIRAAMAEARTGELQAERDAAREKADRIRADREEARSRAARLEGELEALRRPFWRRWLG